MALSKEKKAQIVSETSRLLVESRLTVAAIYPGTPVKEMQELRKRAKENGTQIKVIKNRLFRRALADIEHFKSVKAETFEGQLLYAFNSADELASAQTLANFGKDHPSIKFVAGLANDGELLSADDVTELSKLPSKAQLQSQLLATLSSPWSGLSGVMRSNLQSLSNVLNAKAKA